MTIDYDSILQSDFDMVELENYKLISFDFFDTIAYRTSRSHIRGWARKSTFFQVNRVFAEISARIFNKLREIHEVSERDIYRFMLPIWDISDEKALENILLRPIPETRKLLWKLHGKNFKIIVISDTHFDKKFIENWLAERDFPTIEVFTSSHFRKTKSTGLFEVIQKLKQVPFQNWLHFGDNEYSDSVYPASIGMKTVLVPRIHNQLLESGLVSEKAVDFLLSKGEFGTKVLDNLISGLSKEKSVAVSNRLDYFLGKFVVAPTSQIIADYIEQASKDENFDLILFSSRDGWNPFLNFSARELQYTSKYFKVSRQLAKSKDFVNYVESEIGAAQKIAFFDLGWRGTLFKSLKSSFNNREWHGYYAFFRGRVFNSQIDVIFNLSTSERLVFWQSRDFLEVLFTDPTNGYISLDSELLPVQRNNNEIDQIKVSILLGASESELSYMKPFTSDEIRLLLYAILKFPSQALKSKFADYRHDINGVNYNYLITNNWKSLLSPSPIMWIYASGLPNGYPFIVKKMFLFLCHCKNFLYRIRNLVGIIKLQARISKR